MIRLTDLSRLMRSHKITIRQLAKFMDVTMKRVREVRNGVPVSTLVANDYQDAIHRLVASRAVATERQNKAAAEADLGIGILRQAANPAQCPDDLADRMTAMALVHLNAAVMLAAGGIVCPGCSGQGILTDDPQVLKCTSCGGVFTDPKFPIVGEQAIKFVAYHLPMLANSDDTFYFDLDITRPSDGGRTRMHGWADRQTKRVVQHG